MKETQETGRILDGIEASEWKTYLELFRDANIYQTLPYGTVRWGASSLSHFVIDGPCGPVAAGQVVIRKLPILGVGIAYVPWGPLWRGKSEPEDVEHLRKALKFMKQEYALRQGMLVRIAPNVYQDENEDLLKVLYEEGFKLNTRLPAYRTLVLNLTSPLEVLRKQLKQKWRNQLNRSEKNDLEVVSGTEDELYLEFLRLQGEMKVRKGFIPGVDYNEFREIQQGLKHGQKMKIFLCKSGGETICSTVCSSIGDTGIYLLGATGDRGMHLKGSYLLQWRILEYLKGQGCIIYDLGGINPVKNPGVYHFKSGLNGVERSHCGYFECAEKVSTRVIVNVLDKARETLRRYQTDRINQ